MKTVYNTGREKREIRRIGDRKERNKNYVVVEKRGCETKQRAKDWIDGLVS